MLTCQMLVITLLSLIWGVLMVKFKMFRSLLTTVSATCLLGLGAAAHAMTLEEAVRAAVNSNPTSKAADANVRASAMELLQLER